MTPAALVSVQSVVVDAIDRLGILDPGSPMFRRTEYGGPKLVCVDLTTDRVVKKILLSPKTALPTTYLPSRFLPSSRKYLVIVWAALRWASVIRHLLGDAGCRAISKVLSLVLAAIGVTFVRSGVIATLEPR